MTAIFNFALYILYHFEIPAIEKFKIGSEPWPWYENPKEFKELIKKSVVYVSINSLLVYPGFIAFGFWLNNWQVDLSFDVKDLPGRLEFFITIVFCMLCEDMCFHFGHRLLHTKALYPYIHKIHHEYKSTLGIAAEYSHPIEYALGVLLPSGLSSILLGKHMHMATFLAWSIVRISESIDGHCGYEFPCSPYRLLPLSTSSEYHAYHHSHNIGNFSSMFSIWDTVFGSNLAYYKY